MSGEAGKPVLISVDWGTTSLRCVLVGGDSTVFESTKSERGILKTDGMAFGDILFGEIEPWLARFDDEVKVPVIMSGMIGSRQGWQEAVYLRCPASPDDVAQNLSIVDTAGSTLAGCDVRIVPGMDVVGDHEGGELADVMRGEETQVLGALLDADLEEAVFVLPGTHSKWVFVEDGKISEFRTFMTGEIYSALLSATILGQLAEDDQFDDAGFALGVTSSLSCEEWAGPGNLLNMVFSARSRVLHGELTGKAVTGYLSGLLIGAEVQAGADAAWFALSHDEREEAVFHIIGEEGLRDLYSRALAQCDLKARPVTRNPVPIAHLAIARLAGLVA